MNAPVKIQSFEAFEAETLALIQPPMKSHFGAVKLGDLDKPGVGEVEHLIKGLIARGEVSMLVGPSGSGKSFLATDWGLSVGRGIDLPEITVAGRSFSPRVRKGGVVYIAGEGAKGVKKRLRAYLKHYGVKGGDIPFVLLTLPVDLYGSDDHTNMLINEGKAFSETFQKEHGVRLELIVLDTFSASTPGANENGSDDVSRILGRVQRIARECDCAVQIVHHMNASGSRERGHSSLRANVDSVIEVRKLELKDSDGRVLRSASITKQKDGDDGGTWRFVLRSVELGRDEDDDPITSCVIERPNMDAEQQAVGFKLTPTEEEAFGALVRAIKTAGVLNPAGSTRCPNGTLAIHYRDWRDEYTRSTVKEEDSDPVKRKAAIRKALERAGRAFIRFGLIGKDESWIWRTNRKVKGIDAANPETSQAATQSGQSADKEPAATLDDYGW